MHISDLREIPADERVELHMTTGVLFTGYVRFRSSPESTLHAGLVINDGAKLEAGDRPRIHDITISPEHVVSWRFKR